jgi:hypothetical protein
MEISSMKLKAYLIMAGIAGIMPLISPVISKDAGFLAMNLWIIAFFLKVDKETEKGESNENH